MSYHDINDIATQWRMKHLCSLAHNNVASPNMYENTAVCLPPRTISLKRSYFKCVEVVWLEEVRPPTKYNTLQNIQENLFHCLNRKHTVEYNQAIKARKEETLEAGDVQPRSKQTTKPGCAPYDRKSKRWMESTDVATYPCLWCMKNAATN